MKKELQNKSTVILLFAVIMALSLFFCSYLIAGAETYSHYTASEVLNLINQAREQAGLTSFRPNPALEGIAAERAEVIKQEQYFSHTTLRGIELPQWFIGRYDYQVAGENLALDFSRPEDLITAWLNSPTHRANLLNNCYTETGLAVQDIVYQNQPMTLVVQIFGQPEAESQPVTEKLQPLIPVNPWPWLFQALDQLNEGINFNPTKLVK